QRDMVLVGRETRALLEERNEVPHVESDAARHVGDFDAFVRAIRHGFARMHDRRMPEGLLGPAAGIALWLEKDILHQLLEEPAYAVPVARMDGRFKERDQRHAEPPRLDHPHRLKSGLPPYACMIIHQGP